MNPIRSLFCLLVCSYWAASLPATNGQDLLGPGSPEGPTVASVVDVPESRESSNVEMLVRALILDSLPPAFEDSRDWGKQIEVYDGIRFRRDRGGKLETERHWRLVNDGTWRRFSTELVDPERNFQVSLTNVRSLPDGIAAFDLSMTTPLTFQARQAEWWRGVQLYSISLAGAAKIRLVLSLRLSTSLELQRIPPDLRLHPHVAGAKLELLEFKIDRVSKLGGEFAQQISSAAQTALQEKASAEEPKLVEKLNQQIHRKQDRLRLSLSSAAKLPWVQSLTPVFGNDVQTKLKVESQGK